MCVVADFAEMHTFEDYDKALAPLKEIDIAMLFLNAGIGCQGAFVDVSTSRIERLLQINVQHPTLTCKAVLTQMLNRQ